MKPPELPGLTKYGTSGQPFTDRIAHLAGRDRPVILVEGTRNVPESDRPRLVAMGRKLAETLPRALFRTGGASGADEAFAEGIRQIDPARIEYVLPQAGHRRKNRDAASPVFALEQLPDTGLRAVAEQTASASPKYESLAQRYIRDTRTGALAAKTRYLLRDTLKVTGDPAHGLPPANLGVFYVDETAPPLSGGTGHTIRVCLQHGVPVYSQEAWGDWVSFIR